MRRSPPPSPIQPYVADYRLSRAIPDFAPCTIARLVAVKREKQNRRQSASPALQRSAPCRGRHQRAEQAGRLLGTELGNPAGCSCRSLAGGIEDQKQLDGDDHRRENWRALDWVNDVFCSMSMREQTTLSVIRAAAENEVRHRPASRRSTREKIAIRLAPASPDRCAHRSSPARARDDKRCAGQS